MAKPEFASRTVIGEEVYFLDQMETDAPVGMGAFIDQGLVTSKGVTSFSFCGPPIRLEATIKRSVVRRTEGVVTVLYGSL